MTVHSASPAKRARKLSQAVALTLAAFALLLSIAPTASAEGRTRETKKEAPVVLLDTVDCPDTFVLGPHGCQPDFYTHDDGGGVIYGYATFVTCPKTFVLGPTGCQPGFYTHDDGGGVIYDYVPPTDCPKTFVLGPTGCQPGFYTSEPGGELYAVYTCPFGDACDDMIEAIIALGGTCTSDGPDTGCTLPPFDPDPRD